MTERVRQMVGTGTPVSEHSISELARAAIVERSGLRVQRDVNRADGALPAAQGQIVTGTLSYSVRLSDTSNYSCLRHWVSIYGSC